MNTTPDLDLLAIVGHTAGGKTALAAAVAQKLNGEVISADSRQVYRGMDLGTGKDYQDYCINGEWIPAHLIDIREAGEKYTLFDFKEDFQKSSSQIRSQGKLPILCGGTGLYVEAVLKGYPLVEVPADEDFRHKCEAVGMAELENELRSYGPLHNVTDILERDRLVRALEIARFEKANPTLTTSLGSLKFKVFGVVYEREERRERITTRLKQRLESGMIEEVRELLRKVPPENLIYYGLEYKYLTLYCQGMIEYDEMFRLLNTAIHQFSKRQMTWFRGMEKRGIPIVWIPGNLTMDEKLEMILNII
jgi:tRNA dimethylallyltransferase